MVFLGFGKYARSDKIYALQPITGDDRGGGQRTLVWVEGVADPLIASRTERTILHDMGQEPAGSPLLDEALSLAERLADDAASGRVDLADLGRRARKLLESSSTRPERRHRAADSVLEEPRLTGGSSSRAASTRSRPP